MAGQDRVSPSPAEADGADFVGAGDQAHGADEAFDQGAGDGLSVLDEPGRQRGGRDGRGGRFVGQGAGLAFGERRLDGVEEGYVYAVVFVDVGDVDVEACCCVLVG